MTVQEFILAAGATSTLAPVIAVFVRGGSRYMVVATALTAVAVSATLLLTLRLIHQGAGEVNPAHVYTLMASAAPVLLACYLSAVGFGRASPDTSFLDSRRTFLALGLVGAGFLAFLHRPSFVAGYGWENGRGTIFLGYLGKAYLTYLLVGLVVVGYNLEKTYRVAAADMRHRLRLPVLGIFCCLFYLTFILTSGLLYASIGLGKLVAAALPIGFINIIVAYSYLRRSLSDVAAPVSRTIVYSSFTALAAGLFVAAMGAAAQVAAWTNWSPDEILVLTAGIVTMLTAVLLLLSNRFQRQVRRFIDRNFYVNRYDYRSQWHRVTEAFMDTTDRTSILNRTAELLEGVFLSDAVTIALSDQASGEIRPALGKGVGGEEVLSADSPLWALLAGEKKSILIDRKPDDFTFIPVYAENGGWLDHTASQIIAPLLGGSTLIGTLGLERSHGDDPFTFEDVSLLDSIAAHVSSTLHADRLTQDLADTRGVEIMSQWSSMILHDLKNYLAPLRMVARNLEKNQGRADVAMKCARDIELVSGHMDDLVHTLTDIRLNPKDGMVPLCPNELVEECLDATQVRRRDSLELATDLNAESRVVGNRDMLRRVVENLIVNAIDAMPEGGRLSIDTRESGENGNHKVAISVADTGVGIPEDFLQNRLFRPFATTKKRGLGLGLYQSRSIVHAHGGRLTASSRPGAGSRMLVELDAAPSVVPDREVPDCVASGPLGTG